MQILRTAARAIGPAPLRFKEEINKGSQFDFTAGGFRYAPGDRRGVNGASAAPPHDKP